MKLDTAMSNELRGMVREVLHDVMAQRSAAAPSGVETVRLSNDAELQAFVLRLLDPALQERIRSGKLRFTLGGSTTLALSSTAAPSPAASTAALTGVITEKAIDRMSSGGILLLATGAVLTPLARDRARRLGLKIERRP